MLGIIIQARLGSTRLPNKMLIPFYNKKGILELIIDKLKANFNYLPIIIATSVNSKDKEIADLAKSKGVECFIGSENNVLKRFIDASEKFKITKIIRICADNPFLNTFELDKLISEFKISNLDYLSFQTSEKIPIIKTHYGLWAEAININALKRIKTKNNHYLEHVTNFIYEHPENFKLKFINILNENNAIRLTTDTKEDFLLNKEIYQTLIEKDSMSTGELIKHVSQNSEWVSKMKNQINKNKK